jgi:hypothetical protein
LATSGGNPCAALMLSRLAAPTLPVTVVVTVQSFPSCARLAAWLRARRGHREAPRATARRTGRVRGRGRRPPATGAPGSGSSPRRAGRGTPWTAARSVPKPYQGAVAVGDEGDLHGARARWQLAGILPAPGEDQAVGGRPRRTHPGRCAGVHTHPVAAARVGSRSASRPFQRRYFSGLEFHSPCIYNCRTRAFPSYPC